MYTIYDITNVGAAYFLEWLEKHIDGATHFKKIAPEEGITNETISPVQKGLSSGETRQVLLDHYKTDFKNGKIKKCITHLESLKNELNRKNNNTTNNDNLNTEQTFNNILEKAKKSQLTIEDIEEFLYTITDNKLNGIWVFENKLIYII